MTSGSCLCGGVKLSVARRPRKLTQCNCSVCRRYGTLWAYYKRRAVSIAGKLRDWRRPGGELRFCHCVTCACVVSWEAHRGLDARMGVNMRLFDPAALATVPIGVLDGDKTWKVLERYTKPNLWHSP